jgi:DNA-binding LacI/PurR family transcriptional regulator
MSERLRIEDVAVACGVSKATVSQVLRNTGRISPETRAKVLRTAERIGYVYNRAAANLRAGRSTIVGIGITSLTNPFFADLVSGATGVLESEGYYPMVTAIEDDPERQIQFALTLRENSSAGAIICLPPDSTEEQLAVWKTGTERCVTVLRPPPLGLFDYVGVDNEAGMILAAEYLIRLGHRQIGYLGGGENSHSRRRRLHGWRQALSAANIANGPERTEGCAATITAASAAVDRLIERVPDLTAIICHQDVVAFGATIGLRKLGRRPGIDISVVGFDDITMSRDWDPPLTTVSVTPVQLGAEAARLLTRRLAEPDAPLRSLYIQPELIVRQSSGPPVA